MSTPLPLRTVYRACHLCEAICGVEIRVRGETIESIRGDREDPLGRGHLCPKGVAMQDLHSDPDRLRHPLRRTAGGWKRIGWREAFDEVGTHLRVIQRRHGRDAVGLYLGNPNVHNYGTLLYLGPFLKTLGTRNRFTATSLDQLPHMLASALMFGHPILFPVPDLDRTDYLVIMGGNPAVSNGSLMTAPDVKNRLRAIRARGGKVVVLDPRRTETARLADRHHFVRPGSDPVLLLAILHHLHTEKLARPGRLEPLLAGLDAFWNGMRGTTPEQAAPITGLEAGTIRQLAEEFARAPRAVWYGRFGVCTQPFGGLTMWLIYALNIVTGRLDHEGGAMFPRPALDPISLGMTSFGGFARWRSRVRGLPEFDGELPASVMAEEMETPGPGQIRAMITMAGNPALSAPNGTRVEKALAGLDFLVCIDPYLNETTRHAHVILPPTNALEHENYDLAYHLLAIRNTARLSPALFQPPADSRHDWEILLELDTRLRSRGVVSGMLARIRRGLMRRIGPRGQLDLGLRLGPYGAGWKFWRRGLTLRTLERHPHGIDFGPLEPCLPGRLCTRDRRIHLAPAVMLEDLARLRATFFGEAGTAPKPGDLLLIGRRDLRGNNSWMHNSERLMRGPSRCTLLMHPDDARTREIANGEPVRVTSRVGSLVVEVEVSDEIMPGVVSLPHGWGHTRPGTQQRVASRQPGVSLNDLTDDQAVDALSGNAVLSRTAVTVAREDGGVRDGRKR